MQAFYLREDLISFCREAPPGTFSPLPLEQHLTTVNINTEFTEHQRHVFCVFSGEGVNRLRNYLNESPDTLYDTEGTMYDDREGESMDTDHQVVGLMHATGLNDDDDDDMDEVDGGDGSQYELEGER